MPVYAMLPQQQGPGLNQPPPADGQFGPQPLFFERLVDVLTVIQRETGVDAGLKFESKLAEWAFGLNLPKTIIIQGVLGSSASSGEEDRIYRELREAAVKKALAEFRNFLARARAVAALNLAWAVVNQPVAFRDP